tara:strand:+ start:3585 stop:4469 length:885 start_codon:yes stop_codon:yes gene_type:complete
MNKISSIQKLEKDFVLELYNLTGSIKKSWPEISKQNKTVCLLFWEPSTRTKLSFEHAAKKLGFDVIDFSPSNSSLEKGESFEDTIKTILALKVDGLIVRHPETKISEKIVQMLPENVFFINAGDGNYAHPTQGLLDVFTMSEVVDLTKLNLTILGDAKHSRVIPSLLQTLDMLGCKNINYISPESLALPQTNTFSAISNDMLSKSDILYILRIQRERFSKEEGIDDKFFSENYQVNKEFIETTNFQGKIMHPGPINIGVEITRDISDGEDSLILKQVENGLYLRTALLQLLSSG